MSTAKKLFAGVSCLASLILIVVGHRTIIHCLSAQDSQSDSPAIALYGTEYDFGTVEANKVYRTKFRITNKGGRRLFVSEEERSCRCLAANQSQVIVNPDSSAAVEVTLDTKGLQGALRQEVRYSTNDPKMPEFVFHLYANVVGSTVAGLPRRHFKTEFGKPKLERSLAK